MPESTSNNAAGELNVKFRADASPVRQAAAEAKAALGEVGAQGKASGEQIAEGAQAGASGIGTAIDAMKELKRAVSLVTNVILPVAAVSGVVDLVRQAEAHINRANEELLKQLDAVNGVNASFAERIRLARAAGEVEKQAISDLMDADKARLVANAEVSKQIAEEEARLEQLRFRDVSNHGVENMRTAIAESEQRLASLERERQANIELVEARRKALENVRRQHQEEARLREEEQTRADMIKGDADVRARAAAYEAEQQQIRADMIKGNADVRAEADRREAEHAREMLEMTRKRLDMEREITREKNAQRAGFGVENVPFFSSSAMSGAMSQGEISQKWSD